MSSQRILITGATGLIGRHSLASLADHSADVWGTYCHQVPGAGLSQFQFRQLDLTSPTSEQVLADVAPDVIVHCSALIPKSFQDESATLAAVANLQMDKRILDYCRATKCRLVYVSGTSIYGFQLANPTLESSPVNPAGPYVAGKYESEKQVAQQLDNYAILRVSAPYGIGQRSRTVLHIFVERAMSNLVISYFGTGNRQQDFTSARDVARAIAVSVSATHNGIYNVASGQPISMKALAELVVRETQSQSEIVAAGKPDPQEDYQPHFGIEKIATELGWKPKISLAEGIRELVEHFRQTELPTQK